MPYFRHMRRSWLQGLLWSVVVGCVLCSCGEGASQPVANETPTAPPAPAASTPAKDAPEEPAPAPSGERLKQTMTYEAMGTMYEFTLYAEPGVESTAEIVRIADEAFRAVQDLEERISRWVPSSQTAYINNHAAKEPVKVAYDILQLLLFCKQVHKDSGGAFDVTVGPLIKLWGFYKGEGHLPGKDELAGALSHIGLDKVVVDEDERTVAFKQQEMLLDFGGIGKGLALDKAAEVIRSYGVTSAVLHAGTSTVLAIGAPPGKPGWTVRIRDPYNKNGYVDEVVLKDESLSTSGSYEKFFELDGKKYSHIFDPRTGAPVEGILSATAIAPTGTLSDALSTSFFVMGPQATKEYCIKHPEVWAIFVPIPEKGTLEPRRVGKAAGKE